MHNQRIVLIMSAIAGIIGTFLPYMKSWINSASLFEARDGTGYIIIAAFGISLIVSLIGNQKEAMTKGHLAGAIIPGVIPAIILLLLVLSRMNDDLVKFFTNFEIGFYLVVISSLSILVFGLALNDNRTTIPNTSTADTLFCSGCGKKHSVRSAGEFCDECGNKL